MPLVLLQAAFGCIGYFCKIEVVKRRLLIVFTHIVIWALFLLLPTLFKPHTEHLTLIDFEDDLLYTPRFVNSIFLVSLFYLNYTILIPQLFFRKRYVYFTISVLLAIVSLACINVWLLPQHKPNFENHSSGFTVHMNEYSERHEHGKFFMLFGPDFNLFMFICIYFFAFALSFYEQWQHAMKDKLNAEIAFLKAQINPHFLFNTLNSIYSLALTKSDDTPDAVVKLSAIMRYSVTESQKQYVNLNKEITYISNYIELQKLRLTDNAEVEAIYKGDFESEKIAPLLLMPFVENAFKHGISPEENSVIKVHIELKDHVLKMTVINNKVYIQNLSGNIGLGIENTQQRLGMLYPNNYKLAIRENDETFEVNLQIELS